MSEPVRAAVTAVEAPTAGRAAVLTARIAAHCADAEVRQRLEAVAAALAAEEPATEPGRTARLRTALRLSPFELDLVLLTGLPEEHEALTHWARLGHPLGLPQVTPATLAEALGLDPTGRRHLRAALEVGRLHTSGLVTGDAAEPFPQRGLRLPPGLWSCLRGLDTWPGPALRDVHLLTVGTHGLPAAAAARLRRALTGRSAQPLLVAVTGAEERPATERAALVLRLGRELDCPMVLVDAGDASGARQAQAWSLQAVARGVVPVVVGAAPAPGGAAPAPLPDHPGVVVACPPGGERAPSDDRPLVTAHLGAPDVPESVALWEALLPGTNGTARSLAGLARVDALSARRAVADAWVAGQADPDPTGVLNGLRQRADAELPPSARLERPTVGWADLITSAAQEALLRSVVDRMRGQARVLHDWGLAATVHGGGGARGLLTGPPGTGKSLAAAVIAAELGLDLMVVDLGALMSKWLGETEKNLGAVFDAARRVRSVLFFDEADAIFGRRTEVADAQSRWANLQTAYVLGRIDRFDGLVLLATNLRSAIDDAFVRRLDVVVEFDEPDREQRLRLWRRHLPPTAPLADDVDLAALAALYEITGALIRNAVLAAAFAAAARGTVIDQDALVQATRHEYEKAGRSFPGRPRRTAGPDRCEAEMAQDLKTRAERQLDLNEAALAEATTALGEARTEQDRRVADPSGLTPQQWATGTGARQHVELARAAVAAELATQAAARVRLSQVSSPADVETHEAELRASLTRLAGLRVLLRHGREREQTAAHRVRALGAVVDAAAARVSASQGGVTQATVDQKAVQAALDALDDPPLDTIVADASALRSGATFTGARDRLADLLPEALRERAHQRYAESTKLVDEAIEHLGTARAAEEKATAEINPSTTVSAAETGFRTALGALSAYVASAAADLAAAEAALEAVAAFPGLSQEQVNALNPDGRVDAVAAAAAEQALADAVAEVAILQQAVDDAILSARIDDPDSDPETNEDVIAARAALDDEAVQQALTDARAAYGQARRDALDAWEVEVPEKLWEAVTMFESASATLDRLASTPVRDGLVSGLETAQNAYADALDDADVALRRLQVARLEAAVRGARALAAAELSADRAGQYTRGDGPAGRTADQL